MLQGVVQRTYLLLDNMGALPASKELAACTGEEQEHMVSRMELSWLGQQVVDPFLFLWAAHMCSCMMGDTLNQFLHVLNVVNEGAE